MTEAQKQRVIEEFAELGKKMTDLQKLVDSEEFGTLPHTDVRLLRDQLAHMEGYFSVLSMRMARF